MGRDTEQSRRRLETLGERESGTARLEEAVAAYRAALTEWTRGRVPLYWARTQEIWRSVPLARDPRGRKGTAELPDGRFGSRGGRARRIP